MQTNTYARPGEGGICIKEIDDITAVDFGQIKYDSWDDIYRDAVFEKEIHRSSVEEWIDNVRQYPKGKYVAYVDGRAAGIAWSFEQALTEAATFYDRSSEIDIVYVLKEFRRKGVGTALYQALLGDIGENCITVFVVKGNDDAVEFFKAMGFEFTGKEIKGDGEIDIEMVTNIDKYFED